MTTIGNFASAPVDIESEISYGTHTLPRGFWTSGKPSILGDADFRRRRIAKRARHEQNGNERAESNRNGPSRSFKK